MAEGPPADRPDVAEKVSPQAREQAPHRGRSIAGAAAALGPVFVVAAAVSVFLPLGQIEVWIAIALLAVAPATVALAWLPGGAHSRARSATTMTAALVGIAVGWVGFQANPCAADPMIVGPTAVAMAVGTFLVSVAIGRVLALGGRAAAAFVAAGVVAFLGFLGTAFAILPNVFVLC